MINPLLPLTSLLVSAITTNALPYDPAQVAFNLNQNQNAKNPLEYWGKWDKPSFHPSPRNWRFPFYTIFLDRFANGDPTNDNANGTVFEHDITSNQFRNGGDIKGLMDTLDYIQGMGIKGIYVAGSIHINQPWVADSYSPLDLTLLDHHFGNLTAWRQAITEIHSRGMYVVLENTMSTLGDLIGFQGFLNTTAPFSFKEHRGIWKTDRRYHDFQMSDTYLEKCNYPRFWTDKGEMVSRDEIENLVGCLDSDFDQYGDAEAFGEYPEWQRQLSKFGHAQDRLREWRPSVLDKIKRFSCITVAMLDIDGFRVDKGLTITVEAQADWSNYIRQCAKDLGKDNFFIPGEIVGGNALASLYVGRGKEPQMALHTAEDAITAVNASNQWLYIRNSTRSALDSVAFHYSIYRIMIIFLGLDGISIPESDMPLDLVDAWNTMLQTNDFINQNTGNFDPRHMYGVTNQDVFRWPALKNGVQKNLLGLFVTTLILPGIPTIVWGEEQANYVLDNTAGNYVFGRSPMTSSRAWQMHGCYNVELEQYANFPWDAALYGCTDGNVSLDHRDPSHAIRNVLRRMYELRQIYPVLNDGYLLQRLSQRTYNVFLPENSHVPTEIGLWSVLRSRASTQDFTGQGQGDQSIWLIYGNENRTIDYTFNCENQSDALVAPFNSGTKVRNLFSPYEEYDLTNSSVCLRTEGSSSPCGCLSKIQLSPWAFKALVPSDRWVDSAPAITKFSPGHDYRLLSSVAVGQQEIILIGLYFSKIMDCQSVTNSIHIESNTEDSPIPIIESASVACTSVEAVNASYSGGLVSLWTWSAKLVGVSNGVHAIVVKNASTQDQSSSTNSVDRFLLRVGQADNPIVFPHEANYSTSLLYKSPEGSLHISHKAAGATKFRYSTDWNTHYSDWMDYTGGYTDLAPLNWTGTKLQSWDGDHVYVQYWSNLTASSNHYQHGDLRDSLIPRRFPHLFVQGLFNQYGFDTRLPGEMYQDSKGTWLYDFMTEWPASFQLNVWGRNADGQPDRTLILGDIDGDGVLDRIPPGSLLSNVINITDVPPSPYVAWSISVNDATFRYTLKPTGSRRLQMIIFILLAIIPIVTAVATVYIFIGSFYKIEFNNFSVSNRQALSTLYVLQKFKAAMRIEKSNAPLVFNRNFNPEQDDLQANNASKYRRRVLIATMEYDIEDWAIEIKIGGLGVMAQLMGKNLGHCDLIWVVPCVGGIDYPTDLPARSMFITILDNVYEVQVQCHILRNITYVLLDAPVFRKQSRSEPYPARMDDLESAIYYSAWNQCIALAIQRFEVSLYHINDYHGALAPLHLLPKVIPCCLSLHNAEFQGCWPMRTHEERYEVCKVFNIDPAIAEQYIQFEEVFNLLHGGASYLRIHQKGFGAVGVSQKYGKRSFARYPIFWGLSKIGSLPNPDPTDTAEWQRDAPMYKGNVEVDKYFEGRRPEFKRQAQIWAGLDELPDAELFVFLGRWAMQKGIDLIADVFPSILEKYPKVQLICVGPLVDLYGRFAALKLEKIMSLYPGRVYSKPEFATLPPYLFSGTEFILIPSRDEPFGLVAVEFGHKGALAVGARVGGLGQMPGWWYSIESVASKHLLRQFRSTIHRALASSQKTRSMMRARSALQRFPVAQWVEGLNTIQETAIIIWKENGDQIPKRSRSMANLTTFFTRKYSNSGILDRLKMLTQPGSTLHTPRQPGSLSGWSTLSSFHSMESLELSPQPDEMHFLLPVNAMSSQDSIHSQNSSALSYHSIAGDRKDFALQKVNAFFTDAHGIYLKAFKKKLEKLSAKSSENFLCIEDNLVKSEKHFFDSYREAKMGYTTRAPSLKGSRSSSSLSETLASSAHENSSLEAIGPYRSDRNEKLLNQEFSLGENYEPPIGLKRVLLIRIGGWPIYAILLAFGQIIAANSYQITLLIGEVGETTEQLYAVALIYLGSSVMWWFAFRRSKTFYLLSIPFAFYGMAFLLIGTAPFALPTTKEAIQKVATGFYAVGSASGSFYFALNFGDEGAASTERTVIRACLVQGAQQVYASGLWYWGSSLAELLDTGTVATGKFLPISMITGAAFLIAVFMWVVGAVIALGLPDYYRQAPGKIPSFYRSLYRRKIILWFLVAAIIQNYWLSAPYGRNWRYLWTTQHAPAWAILLLVILFFVGIWASSLLILSRLSQSHSWILPVFAIGLGAPRWCQMLWATSAAGAYLPWAGSALASALLGRSLWLWLGVLDAIQGIGFGMILLQTLPRYHICFTLIAVQVLGSIATILARAAAPENIGPGNVFPNFALGIRALATPDFWIGLTMQIIICFGFALSFRQEQLAKR